VNCREFEETMIDCSGDRPVDDPISALAHATICAKCAARLSREERMTAGLRALAAEEAAINAPDRVKSALRAAFDRQAAATSPAPPVSIRSRPKLRWGLAAAAAVLACAPITTTFLSRYELVADTDDVSRRSVANQPGMGRSPVENGLPAADGEPPNGKARPGRERGSRTDRPPSHSAQRARGQVRHRTRPVTESAARTGETTGGEIFPLTFVARSEPTDSVQTVRVEISRSTLLLMGFPVNIDRVIDRAGERVKADLIIGEDGVTRAVRILN
jgi:hypothetical protein